MFFVSVVTSHFGTREVSRVRVLSFVYKLVLAHPTDRRRKNLWLCMRGNIDFGAAGENFGDLGNQDRNRNIDFGAAGENFGI